MAATNNDDDRILALNPDPEKQGTNINREHYEAMKKALLAVIPKKGEGVVAKDLPALVASKLPETVFGPKDSVTWYTVTVKLDLEARGLIVRVPKARPQRLLRT